MKVYLLAAMQGEKGEKEALNESQRNMFIQICFKVLAPPHWIGAPLAISAAKMGDNAKNENQHFHELDFVQLCKTQIDGIQLRI